MQNVTIFEHEQFGKLRAITDENGQPWFVGKEVAVLLGYKNSTDAISKHVEKDDAKTLNVRNFRETRELKDLWTGNDQTNKTLINESGLYSLILGSKLDKAREFKHWVTATVLPQIRRTGGFIPMEQEDDEKTILCKALMIYRRTLEQRDNLIAEQRDQLAAQAPQVRFAQAVTSSQDSILIRDLAKFLTQNGVKIGQGRLFYWLRLHGYLFKNETRPYQKWVELGIFDTDEHVFECGGHRFLSITTRVTGKGQRYFIDGFLSGRFRADNEHLGE